MKGYQSAMPLFDLKPPAPAIEPADPNVLPSDIPRLDAAARRVLARIKEGPATNRELERPECGGSRFGGRLHALRKAGVIWKRRHVQKSVHEYSLVSCPPELS